MGNLCLNFSWGLKRERRFEQFHKILFDKEAVVYLWEMGQKGTQILIFLGFIETDDEHCMSLDTSFDTYIFTCLLCGVYVIYPEAKTSWVFDDNSDIFSLKFSYKTYDVILPHFWWDLRKYVIWIFFFKNGFWILLKCTFYPGLWKRLPTDSQWVINIMDTTLGHCVNVDLTVLGLHSYAPVTWICTYLEEAAVIFIH